MNEIKLHGDYHTSLAGDRIEFSLPTEILLQVESIERVKLLVCRECKITHHIRVLSIRSAGFGRTLAIGRIVA